MLKNAYIEHLVLQKVGHKVREEANIFASKTTEFDESKEAQALRPARHRHRKSHTAPIGCFCESLRVLQFHLRQERP